MTADTIIEKTSPCLFAENQALLIQGAELLAGVPPGIYSIADARCLGGSIGGHMRHCVEFYRAFLDGLETAYLNYDVRAREKRLETDPVAARNALWRTVAELECAARTHEDGGKLWVLENDDVAQPAWSASSVGRELRFLLSHTVHHYALVSILLRLHGMQPPRDFGIAPSTLRHRMRHASSDLCAR